MANILLITSGLSGILNSSFELVRRLEVEGHKVTYASLLDARQKVEGQGFSYLSLEKWYRVPLIQSPLRKGVLGRLSSLFSAYLNAIKRRSEGIELLGQASFRKKLTDLKPDLVLIDIECHEYIFTTYLSGIPLLLISQWFNGQYAEGLPLITTYSFPADGDLSLERIWSERKKKFRFQNLKQKILTAGTDRRSLLLRYAKQIGFPLSLLNFYNWPTPFTYNKIPILHFNDEELELPHRIPVNHYYLGPMVFEDRRDQHVDLELIREKLSMILAKKRANKSKLIYCSVSTMKDSGTSSGFLKKVMAACAMEPDWVLILALSGQSEQFNDFDTPDNTFVFSWLPQLEVLKQTDCSLNHAGINTINECIACEVPMVVYSGGQFDQNGCAVRVAYHKLGVMGRRSEATALSIHKDISEVLNASIYKERVVAANQRSRSEEVRSQLIELVDGAMGRPKDQE